MLSLKKTIAFVKRDFQIESSYKLAFLFQILMSLFPVFSFYFIAKLLAGGEDTAYLERYGGDYFAFVLVGIALGQYFTAALRTFATSVRRAQTTGVLEAILSTQTSPQEVILYSAAYSFVVSTFHVAVVFAGGWAFGVDYHGANLLSVLVTLLLTMAAFSGLGILSATAIVILKKGDPIELLLGTASTLLGGAFFPIGVMPDGLQMIAKALPITYALEAMRLAILSGHSLRQLWAPLAVLSAMALVILPVSLWAFSLAVERGRREGSLIQY
jgi:ABC-2 type transport system permease protein